MDQFQNTRHERSTIPNVILFDFLKHKADYTVSKSNTSCTLLMQSSAADV